MANRPSTAAILLAAILGACIGRSARAAAPNFNDLALNSTYAPGATFTSGGVGFTAVALPNTFSVAARTSMYAGGAGIELSMGSGVGVDIAVPASTTYASFRYGQFAPSSKLIINGSSLPTGKTIAAADGLKVGGVDISILANTTPGASKGIAFLNGPIQTLTVGGTEFSVDDLVLLPTAPRADFDSDLDVDGADFLAWQQNAGLATDATSAHGDTELDADVDGVDLVVWRRTFGTTAVSTSATVAIPEPATILLVALSIAGGAILRRSTQRS